jgi:hypothetical protein
MAGMSLGLSLGLGLSRSSAGASALTGTYQADATVGTRSNFAADTVLPEWGGVAAPEGSEAIATSLELVESGGTVTGTYTDEDGLVCAVSGTYASGTGAVSLTGAINSAMLGISFSGTLSAGTLTGTITVQRVAASGSSGSASEDRSFAAASGGSAVSLPTTRYYVDSLDGDDSNAGTSADVPLATIAALPALSGGEGVYLARGSRWRERLDAVGVDSCTFRGYGAGPRPVLDAHDVLTSGSFSAVGGTTNVYSQSFTPDTGDVGYPVVLEDGRPLVKVADAIAADATAGTYYVSADYAAGAAITIGAHPFGGTDPTSDGKIYEANSREQGIRAGESTTVRAIHNRGGTTKDQAGFEASSTVVDCVFTHAANHSLVVQDVATIQRSVFALWGTSSIGDPTPCTVFTSLGGVTASISGCAFVGDPRTEQAAAGILAHGGTGNHTTITIDDCGLAYGERLANLSASDTATVTDSIAERLVGSPIGFVNNQIAGDLVVERCRVYGHESGYDGTGRFVSNVDGGTTVRDCVMTSVGTSGGMVATSSAGCTVEYTAFGDGGESLLLNTGSLDDQSADAQYASIQHVLVDGPNWGWVLNVANTATYEGIANGGSDYNQVPGVTRFRRGASDSNRASLAAWQSAHADLDQNSVDTSPTYRAGSDSGVRPTYEITSGAVTGGAGPRYGDTITLNGSNEWPVPTVYDDWRTFIDSL